MNKADLDYYKSWFNDYISSFYSGEEKYDYPFMLKKEHTKRVCREVLMICNSMFLSDEDFFLAETIALFHDLGRFKQYARYGTFKDSSSVNHAKQGVRELIKHNVLSRCSNYDRQIIIKAVAFHNAAHLPENQPAKTLFHMKLIRDADKLDIWRIFADYYKTRENRQNNIIELGVPDLPEYSSAIIQSLEEKRLAHLMDMKTLNDFKLVQISWIFDLNFSISFKAAKEYGYVEQIAASLRHTAELENIIKKVLRYLDDKAEI